MNTHFNVADAFLRAALRADSPPMFNVIQFVHQAQGHEHISKCVAVVRLEHSSMFRANSIPNDFLIHAYCNIRFCLT